MGTFVSATKDDTGSILKLLKDGSFPFVPENEGEAIKLMGRGKHYVLKDDGKIVAWFALIVEDDDQVFLDICIAESHQGRCLSKKTLKEMGKIVFEDNKVTHVLFESFTDKGIKLALALGAKKVYDNKYGAIFGITEKEFWERFR